MYIEGTKQHDEVEALRLILENEQKRVITYDEALEIGESLVSYFKTLANQEDTTMLGI